MRAASLLVAILLGAVSSTAHADDRLVQLSEKVGRSVVHLIRDDRGSGSGFVAGPDLVVTNHHVVEGCQSVAVKFRGNAIAKASGVLHLDKAKDIAVLKVPTLPELMRPLAVRPSLPKQGEDVAAFGNPKRLEFSVTRGIVSALRSADFMKQIFPAGEYSGTWIQTDAAISSGNSGGPLVDYRGQVVGINSGSHPDGENLNFAISCVDIRDALKAARAGKLTAFSEAFKGSQARRHAPTLDVVKVVRQKLGATIAGLSLTQLKLASRGHVLRAFKPTSAKAMMPGQIVRLRGTIDIIQIQEGSMLFTMDGVKCMSLLPPGWDGAVLRAKLGDGRIRSVPVNYPFYVVRAESYTTVKRTRSYYMLLVPIVLVVDEGRIREMVQEELTRRDHGTGGREDSHLALEHYTKKLRREFKDRTGKFDVDAVIVGVREGTAEIVRMDDGSPVRVSVRELSDEDQQWIAHNESWIRVFGGKVRAHVVACAEEQKSVDQEANLAAGKYHCFIEGNWDKGLPLLAAGSDESLSKLATRELQGVEKPEKQTAVGDQWWTLAEREKGAIKQAMQARAAFWYRKALPALSALAKDKVNKKLEQLEPKPREVQQPPEADPDRIASPEAEPDQIASPEAEPPVDPEKPAEPGVVESPPAPDGMTIVAECGFNDEAGIGGDTEKDQPYRLGIPVHGQGDSESGWEGPWRSRVSNSRGGQKQCQVVADNSYEGDGALSIQPHPTRSTVAWREWNRPLNEPFAVEVAVMAPNDAKLTLNLKATGASGHMGRGKKGIAGGWSISRGRLLARDGSKERDTGVVCRPEAYTVVRLKVDPRANQFVLSANGKRYEPAAPLKFRHEVLKLQAIEFMVSSGTAPPVKIDAVRIGTLEADD